MFRTVTQTLDGQDNIFAGYCGTLYDGTLSVVFTSQRMLSYFQHQRKVFADGTFKKRPMKPESSQIFNLSCTWENRVTRTKHTIVAVRILMLRRTEAAYTLLLNYLKHLMPQWNPSLIVSDHERAQVNSWLSRFPDARIVTCLWHYAVDVYKYAKQLLLHILMLNDPVVDGIVRCCCSLPLLPNYAMERGLNDIEQWAWMTNKLRIPAIRSLIAYIRREWLSNRLEYLSVCGCEDRTNNISESVNAALAWEVPQDRPQVFALIRAFVRQEDQFVVDIHSLTHGQSPGRAQRVASLGNDERVSVLTDFLQIK